jgi:hypothetical protein
MLNKQLQTADKVYSSTGLVRQVANSLLLSNVTRVSRVRAMDHVSDLYNTEVPGLL